MSNDLESALWAILDLLRPYSDELGSRAVTSG